MHARPGWLVGVMTAVLCAPAALAAEPALKTGQAFRQELGGLTDIFWKDQQPLRDALVKLSAAKQIAIVLDRRIDPDQRVSLTVSEAPLEQALRQLAARNNLGIAIFDSTVYFGPEALTARLGTAAAAAHEKSQQAPAERSAKWKSLPPLETAPLSTPRELLEDWARHCDVRLYQADKIPHDLWPALHFPAQTAASRASLILAGFDLGIEFSPDGTAARVIPLPENVSLTRSYPGGGNPPQRAAQIARQFPAVTVKAEDGKLTITGSLEHHDDIARLLRGETVRRTVVGPGEKRYTLSVENQPLGGVAKALAEQAKLEIEFDAALNPQLGKLVSFQVKDATLAQLLEAMLKPLGMQFTVDGDLIQVSPGR